MSNIENSIIGFAIGDALGVPVEFKSRSSLKFDPVVNMRGFGIHYVPRGTWSDDTSMMLATICSINENGKIDCNDIAKNFLQWKNDARFTATDTVFDIGNTTKEALNRFEVSKDYKACGSCDENSNGNGSLMRMLPIALYCYYKNLDENESYLAIKNISSITHAHEISILGCYLYCFYVKFLLKSGDKFKALKDLSKISLNQFSSKAKEAYQRIFEDDFSNLKEEEINSTGYIVHSLEASIWCLLKGNTFKECVLKAVNLGFDTDTIGAITASIASILYPDIPQEWTDSLIRINFIKNIAQSFEKTLLG